MKRTFNIILLFSILFLFFIQAAGTLVESIYILNLMNSSLNANALGILFFFTPAALLPFHKKHPRGVTWFSVTLLIIARSLLPYLITTHQVLAAGLGILACINLIFILARAKKYDEANWDMGYWASLGFALAIGMSVFLRTVEHGLDYSLTSYGGWVGWVLCIYLGWSMLGLEYAPAATEGEKKAGGTTVSVIGIILLLTLAWFSFSAPAVIARWTEGNYTAIVLTISLVSLGWVFLSLLQPGFSDRISSKAILIWNIIFTISLTATILAHRVDFPATPQSEPVIVFSPSWMTHIPLGFSILLLPILFIDMRIFLNRIRFASPSARQLVPGFLLGGLVLTLLVFFHIFTNVWGYVKPVSLLFRNLFWLPYVAITILVIVFSRAASKGNPAVKPVGAGKFHLGWTTLLILIFFGTLLRSLPNESTQMMQGKETSLKVMTFNTQQSNDENAEKSYVRQLALIRNVAPDILALQESDSTRIGLNNNDYVRYFAEKLGYYSFYGPSTVTGTYGTAILSRYPLENTRTVFTFSDTDEIGTAEAEIEVNGTRFTIINVHPDGSDTAMMAFARDLIDRTKDIPNVIALGDFNLRDYEEAYQLINDVFTNSWVSIYPTEISPDGIDMSGENRIDHIFLSPNLFPRNPVYVLPPDSATDHPVHWTEVYWIEE